ncbi:MAG TPA: response regulator transcription factor [Anaerolineae bacterium]|nr:response regulator transcription factor [Anaerolineae bacterium]
MFRVPGRVLVVDDDQDTRDLVTEILAQEGYQVRSCTTGEEAIALLERETFDLILSDIKMPGINGIELLRHVRARGLDTIVILMTAYASVETAVQALRGEAFDYLVKPFSLMELRQRVRHALQARTKPRFRHTVEHYQDLSIDHQAHRVWVGEREIKLSSLEFRVLAYFFECLGRPVSSEELLDRVWSVAAPDECSTESVRSLVHRLRRKLGDDGRKPRYIKNVWGVGYQLGP